MMTLKVRSSDMRSWVQTYWPVGVLIGGLIAVASGWYDQSMRLEKTVEVMQVDVQTLKTSVAVIERSVKENREDTRDILGLLLQRVSTPAITQN